jgi:hypothetical protein
MSIMTSVESADIGSIMQWFENRIVEGENGIVVYPNLETFREICTEYVKDQLVVRQEEEEQKEGNEQNNDDDYYQDNNNGHREQSHMPRIILIATFYDTINAVKHNLSAVGVDEQSRLDDGSLLIVDAFNGYHPDMDGVKKLVASLSERAAREGRIGVSVIANMGFFFLYGGDGKATQLINYEASLAPKTDGGNVRGFSCYHLGDYGNLNDSQKKELQGHGQKKLLKVTEGAAGALAFHS